VRKLAILVAGMPGSGKSLFIEAARELGIPSASMGDSVRREAVRRGLRLDSETLASLSIELRREMGPQAVARLTLEYLPPSDVVVIEGVRSLDEVEFFKNSFRRVVLVSIHSSPKTRFKRLLERGRADDPRSWEEFLERDLRELKFGLGEVIALSDHMLVNEDMGKLEFVDLCKRALTRILSTRKAPN